MSDDYISRTEFQKLEAKSDNAVSNTHFKWVIGGICTLFVGAFFYLLNRIDNITSHQLDHDKIIRLETELAHLKK